MRSRLRGKSVLLERELRVQRRHDGVRRELNEVPRLGDKTFEQAAGFMRIRGAENPLDESAVHPESYEVVDRMAKDLGVTVKDLMRDEALRQRIDKKKYVSEKVGLPTLTDIIAELAKPGRDPREKFEAFAFKEGVNKIEDVQPGMKLPGIVTNVAAFGAFVDIGVHQDGLVHVSQLADRFIKDPSEVVKVQQRVEVTVLEVDLPRKRIALSLKKGATAGATATGGAPRQGLTPASALQNRTGPAAPRPSAPPPRNFANNNRPAVKPAAPTEGWFSAALREVKDKPKGR